MLCSALVFQLYIQADVRCKLCTVLSGSFLLLDEQHSFTFLLLQIVWIQIRPDNDPSCLTLMFFLREYFEKKSNVKISEDNKNS